jgi:hypothetical protein
VFVPSTSWKGVRQPVSTGQELAQENFDFALWLDSVVDAERRVMVSLASQTARVGRCSDADPDADGFFNCLFRFSGDELYPPLAQLALTRRVTRTESSAPARWVVEKRLAERARQLIHFWKPRKEDYLFVVDPGRAVSGGVPAARKLSLIVEVLKKTYPCRILVASEPDCAEAVQTLSREIARWEPLEIPLGKFEEAIAVLAQADLLVSPNSTLFHCAWVLGTPTIGLFGQQDRKEFEPPSGGPTVVVRSTEGLEEADFLKKVDRLLTTFSSHLAPPA